MPWSGEERSGVEFSDPPLIDGGSIATDRVLPCRQTTKIDPEM